MIRYTLSILALVLVTACGATPNNPTANLDAASSAHPHAKFYKVNLTNPKDMNADVNLMDDSVTGPFSGVAIQLPVKKELLKINIEAGKRSKCPMDPVTNTAAGALIKIYPDVDTDAADSFCDIAIVEKNGKKSVVHIYSVGT